MQKSRKAYIKKSFSYVISFLFIILITSTIGCVSAVKEDTAGKPPRNEFSKEHDYNISGNTYTDKTYNFQVTLPNTNWTIKPTMENLGDALQIAALERKGYDGFFISISVSKYFQQDLERFAGIGTYNPKLAKYTYIAGKSTFWATKVMYAGRFEIQSVIYKFVDSGVGYIFSVGYLTQWSGDERFQSEIDEFLNSFTLLNPEDNKGESQISAGGKIGKDKLTNVAVLTMIDLQSDKPSQKTTVLTNELQEALIKTGKFECLDRRNIEKIFQEHKFQQSGMISGDTAIKFGNMIGAKYLVSSNLGQMGETSVIYIQITDVENGKIMRTVSSRCRNCNDDMQLNTISNLVTKLVY